MANSKRSRRAVCRWVTGMKMPPSSSVTCPRTTDLRKRPDLLSAPIHTGDSPVVSKKEAAGTVNKASKVSSSMSAHKSASPPKFEDIIRLNC